MSIVRVVHAVPKMNREGIQSFLMNVYRNIDRSKVQFDFLIHSKENGEFESEIENLGGEVYHLYQLSSHHFLHYQKDLKKFFQRHPYKIIHSHINLLSSFTLKAAMKAGLPYRIAHSHSSSILDRGIKRIVKLFAKSKMNKYATKRIACSTEAAIWQFGKTSFEAGNVEIVPNGIDVERFVFSKEKRTAISNSYLIFVGSGETEEKIKQEVQKLGILDSVIFAGSVKDTTCYYSAFDFFIFPSIYEGLGIALVEGQAAGLPCFLSDSLPIETNLSEQYYPLPLSSSPDEWAQFILQHAHQGDRKCPKSVWQYDIKSTAKRLENLYIKLALN